MNRTVLVFDAITTNDASRSGGSSEPMSHILRRLVPWPLRRSARWPEHMIARLAKHRRFIQRRSVASNADPLDRLRRAGLI